MSAAESAAEWPAGVRVAVAPGGRVLEGGRLVLGGRPVRARRLSDDGRDVLVGWLGGAPVSAAAAHRALARALLDDGILWPRPVPTHDVSGLSIVVPVRDRAAQLERCLESIRASCAAPVLVVDDGSRNAAAVRDLCAGAGARVLRHERSRGAAAARNTGLRASTTPLVAFVDSDVVLPPDWAHRLVAHFADPRVGAVAPRVLALPPARGPIGGYEARHSPLDIGAQGGRAGPGRPVPYVPSAALVVRRAAAGAGFDPAMAIGEDVDLVWRMDAAGWSVRYAPDAHVWHDHRVRLREFVGRRRTYAASVAPLAKRHPGALPAARLSPYLALPWLLAVAGRPRAAVVVFAVAVAGVGRRLASVSATPYRVAGPFVAGGIARTGAGLAQAGRRAWMPLLLPAALKSRRVRLLLGASFAVPVLQDAVRTRTLREVLQDAPLRVLDEVVALWGTLEGCVRERTTLPLRPAWETRRHG